MKLPISIAIIACVSPMLFAQTVRDQYNRPTTITGVVQARSTDFNGQSFIVGIPGQLTRIELLMARETSGVVQDVEVTITRLDRFANSMTPVISRIVPASALPIFTTPDERSPMVSVDFSQTPVPVKQGDEFVILTYSSLPANASPKINLFGGADTYPNGFRVQTESGTRLTAGADSSIDFGFATYVTIPEPGPHWLLVFGVIPLLRRGRRGG